MIDDYDTLRRRGIRELTFRFEDLQQQNTTLLLTITRFLGVPTPTIEQLRAAFDLAYHPSAKRALGPDHMTRNEAFPGSLMREIWSIFLA